MGLVGANEARAKSTNILKKSIADDNRFVTTFVEEIDHAVKAGHFHSQMQVAVMNQEHNFFKSAVELMETLGYKVTHGSLTNKYQHTLGYTMLVDVTISW